MTRFNRFSRAVDAAGAAAPYVRRIAGDEELRDDVRDLVRSAGRLYGRIGRDEGLRGVVYDDRVRKDVEDVLEAIQRGAQRVVPPPAPRRHYARWFFIAAALIGGAIAAVFLSSQGREKIVEPVQRIIKGERPESTSWERTSAPMAA